MVCALLLLVVGTHAVPSWYLRHRVHAHTRLPIDSPTSGCSQAFAPQPCGTSSWSAAVNGTSPGSVAAPPISGVRTLSACQKLCCAAAGNITTPPCLAVVYAEQDSVCHLLDRNYEGRFQPGGRTVVANAPGRSANATRTGNWSCAPVFETAAARFASLGVKAFVRHSKTADEGAWWPSSSDPRDAWHPMVQATNRSLPAEFLAEAKAAGVNVILYHYNKVSAWHARAHPEWVMRWPNGSAIRWARGTGLSPCAQGWVDAYIAQVLQLVDMGAEAFYFDEYPGSAGGDWNLECQKLFEAKYGVSMPTALGSPMPSAGGYLPMALDWRVQQLMSDVTEAYFAKLTAAIKRRNPNAVALVSVFRVPKVDNGFSTSYGGGLYETTQIVASANTVAKTEIEIPAKISTPPDQAGHASDPSADAFERDVLMGFGYAMARDAADARPSHIWIPGLENPKTTSDGADHALCASAALVAYGAVANPDHSEAMIPDTAVFGALYGPGGLASAMDAIGQQWELMRPIRWAAVLWSERARNRYVVGADRYGAWRDVLYPTVGAWRSLLRAGLPATLVDDWQLGGDAASAQALARSTPALISPPRAVLDNATRLQLERYALAGGVVLESPANGSDAAAGQAPWAQAAQRHAIGAALVGRITRVLGTPPVEVRHGNTTLELAGAVHAVPFAAADDDTVFVFVTNNFTACPAGYSLEKPLPPPVEDLVVHLNSTAFGFGINHQIHAVELFTNTSLKVRNDGDNGCSIALPRLDVFLALRVQFENTAAKG